jgi:hypothetical protein
VRLLAFLLLLPLAALGQTWYPVQDGEWTNTATWSTNAVPGAGNAVNLTGYVVRATSTPMNNSAGLAVGAKATLIMSNATWISSSISPWAGTVTMIDSTMEQSTRINSSSLSWHITNSTVRLGGGGAGASCTSGTLSNLFVRDSALVLVAGGAITIALSSYSFSISNSTLTLRGGGSARSWNVTWPNGLLVTTNTARELNTFVTAVECGALTMSSNGPANWATGGYSLTVTGTARTAGTLSMSNSTMFVRDLLNSGVVSQQTSTVSLLAGDNIISNVPGLFNAVKYTDGTARITTNLAVTGTLEFQSGANLDAGGNIIGLGNPGTVGGNLQSGTITGNVLRVDGIADQSSGQLNTPRMGRR